MPFVRTILAPVDFSAHAAKALDFAVGLARQCGATLHVVHALPLQPGLIAPYGVSIPTELEQACRSAAVQRLEELGEKVSAAGVEVELHESAAIPADAIVGLAEDLGADLIVMGSRGLGDLAHVLIGSVTDRVLRTAPCPVLTVRAEEKG